MHSRRRCSIPKQAGRLASTLAGNHIMKKFLLSTRLAAAAILCLGAGPLFAQAYPVKPLRMIIPAGPGGGVDTIGRMVGAPLAAALGQPVVIENRPGAGTMLASELTAKSPPDGYTMLMMTNSHTINASIHKNNLRYDPVNDFTTVSLISRLPYLIVIHPSLPARSVKELIALGKRRPGEIYFASAGIGSGTHLAAELFVSMAGLKMVHVPYKSGTAAMIDMTGGHVQMMISNTVNSMPQVKARRLTALAITTPKRSPLYPDLVTAAESGLPGYEADAWYGLILPGRTPPEIVQRLNREVLAILKAPDMRTKMQAQDAEVIGSSPEVFAQVLKSDIQKWARVTSTLSLQAN